jgi:CRISPR-associated protein Cas2
MDRKPGVVCPDEAEVAMSTGKNWYLVTYDVRDPKRLRKVAKHLEGYGVRMQYSVFRVRMNDRERERLGFEMKRIMDPEDKLLVIGLCERCSQKVEQMNTHAEWPEDPPGFEIV